MFDSHNALDETEPHAAVIERFAKYIAHVHVNEIDGREPGTGDYDFVSLFRKLLQIDYTGWISLEVFDFSRPSDTIAGNSLRYLKEQLNLAMPTTAAVR
jgi:sugar phosphate isomerase/epimerase